MYREIPIYKSEAEAGLSDIIQSSEGRTISAFCPVMSENRVSSSVREITSKHTEAFDKAIASKSDQFDLHYIYAILATTGWNKNDDVFDRYEMWSARNSAEDKPFNKGHDPNSIIGHITGNAVIDENYELVKNNAEVDALPTKFHILTSAVVYKHVSSRDEKLSYATKELLQEIADGKWFVSMEALFSNFDYALTDANNSETVVSRNEETSFLSKHLRSYGGDGEYEGYRVGRLMRNLTFSGKGLVENPGNPESIIFKEEDSVIFEGVAQASPSINLLVTSNCKGESSMSDNNEQVQTLKAQVETLEARLKALDEEKVQAQISEFEAACAGKDAEITELKSQLNAASEAAEASTKENTELNTAKAESDKIIAELTEKLDAIEAESLKTNRISALVDKGVDKADAEALVEKFVGISEEQFEALVETQAKIVELSESAFPPGKNGEEDKKKKKKEDEEDAKMKKYSDKAEEAEAEEAIEEAQDAESLDNAEAEESASLAASSEGETESVLAGLNDYFSEVLGGNNNKDES